MSSTGDLSELDLLRGQVADLSRELAERDRALREQSLHLDRERQDVREQSEMLRAIVQGTAAETGEEYFASLVTHLTAVLKVQYAVIGEVQGDRIKKIHTLAVSAGGNLADNFEYELAHTPCATALTQTFACFVRDVQATFPQFQRLADLGAESYCAVPLRTKDGAVIGLLVVMDTKPLENSDYLQSLLEIFAPRVAAEFERNRAEQERAQALADIRNVMETAPDIMFTLDTQGNMVKWNRRVRDVTGYSPEELLNKPALAFVPSEEQTRTAAAIQRAFTDGYAELDGHLLTKEHRLIPYHWTGALLKNPQGEPIGITGIGRDVSEKKRAEVELRLQRRRLVDAQALAHLGSWDWDVDTGEVEWSDEQFRIFGYEPGAIAVTYDTFLASLHPDDHDPVLAAINDALLGKRPYDVEYRIVRPNGEIRSIHARGDVHRDATGHPLSMAGTVLDITERKQVEESLRAIEERWQLAVRGSNDGIWDWDIQTGAIFFSSRWKALRGFEDHEIANHVDEWRSRIHPDDLDRVLQNLDSYLSEQTPEYCEEYRAQRKDGSYIWVLNRGVALWADDGTPLRMAGSESDITDRKRAEDEQKRLLTELAESQQHFERIFHWTPSAVAISTLAEGRLLDVNDRLVQLTGYSREELIGHTTTELQLWADPPERARVIQEILQQQSLHNKEGLLRTKFGDILAIMVSVDRIQVNATPCLIYVAHDITERKQTEEKLRLSEQRQELALSGANLGLWDWDMSGGKVVFDARWCSMIGYAVDELEPHASTWFSLLHPEDAPAIHTILESHLKNETPDYEGEFRMQHKAGHWIWILARGRVVERDHAGAPLRMAGTHMDITDRKRAGAAIWEAELRYRTIFEQAGSGVAQIESRTGQFVQVNRQYCEILGLTEAEMLATTFGAVTHPDDLKRDLDSMTRLLSGEIPAFTMEKRYVRKDGSIVWVNLNVAPLWRSSETPVHHISIVQDITERKRAEDALRRSECQLRTVLDALPVGVWFTDQRGKPVLSNPAAKVIWSGIKQIRLETAANTPGWWEAIGPSDELHRWALSHALTKGVPSLNETLHLECLDGTKKVIRNTTVPVQDEAGVLLGAIVLNEDITALRQAQEALKLTQFSVDHAVEGFFWIGPDARILNVNDAACRMLEYTRDELTTMTMHDIDPNLPPEIWSAHWEELKQKKSMTFESKHWSRTGRVLDTEVTINFLYYEGSEYTCAIMRDIGERKQANAALRVSEERFRSIFQNEPECVKAVAPDGTLLVMNPAGLIMVGARFEEEVIGKSVLSLIYPDDRSAFQKLHQAVCGGESGSLQFRINSLQDEVRWMDTHSVPLRDAAGGVTAALSITRDITKHKQAEASLRQSEERYRSLVDNAPIGIFVNQAGRFVYVNREMQGILKATSAEQLIGTPVLDRIAPEFHQMVKDRIRQLMDSGQPVPSLDEQFVKLDGSRVDVAVTAIPTSFDGVPVVQVLVLDITERKQLALREASHVRQLKKLYELSMTLSGDPGVVLEHVVCAIGELFKVPVVCLSEIVGQELYFKSVYANGQTFTDAGHCSLAITPCATVAQTKDVRVFDRVMERFPQASFLRDHQASTYCGFPALDNEGRVVAVTCLLDDKPHDFSKEELDLLRIFGQRIAVEIERSRHTAEQKRAADELRHSHAFIRQIIDADPNFIFVKDRDGRFTLVNKAVADAYGTTVDFLIGKTDTDFTPNPDEVEFFSLKDSEVMDSLQERFIPEEVITDSTGRTRWLQTVKRPILDETGRAIMVFGASTDITERKRIEETLRQRERDLRAAVEERQRISQDLHDGILQSLFAVGLGLEASKSAMSPRIRKTSGPPLNQAIDQLNRVMHEIRNFIAGLDSDLLQGKDLPAALKQMLASLTQNQAMHVRLAVEDRAARALSSEQSQHLLLVIQEAVSNCIQHGRAQEARVSLKMLKQGVRLSIRDNGCGFNPETTKGIGHGLGNMAARAQKIGGRFTYLSKVNEGTRIVLDLPKEASYGRG